MIADGNVWQWVHDVAASSPIQPTVNLGTSFIDHNPPDFLIEAHKAALESVDNNQYAPVPGSDSLKQAIAELYSPLYARELDPEKEICITSGAQEGLLASVMSFIQPGDEVILLEPVFAMYVYQTKMAGGTIRYVPLRPPKEAETKTVSGSDWTIDIEELERAITPRTKMIYLNNPHNPLGKVFTRDEVLAIGNLCVRHALVLLSDEVYERILFNATGWRVGFVIGCEALMSPVIATHLVLAYSSSGPAQHACAVGLREAERRNWWEVNALDVAERIEKLCEVLDSVGLTYVKPSSAWFVFVNINKIRLPEAYAYPSIVDKEGTRDWKVCYWLVREFGIASIPGSCFYGTENKGLGERYLRFGACKSDEGLEMAAQRLSMLRPYIGGVGLCKGVLGIVG
ncbi:PLP-dependent transferase [Byssothecium circinans]|uniref:PLP-dependent transferase n=1 Tax=Byssothecium circinans TaxID=147558 RepID=A0A6A5UBV7_9PLEO|nr:PLP-dependent transferase [Byssothecium circinans]